ncbi:hypothetical protein B0H66DRAFT_323053 [Apodospora peruviana]|uniref:Uncharacterized protein n=1 Tax=Apodospora peruviana TaxID=516989 RepID=A0AAE0HXS1_9PEZI|nr:hypothetical protein B0H66DRAFT_323053 [Apodospora peruviana]
MLIIKPYPVTHPGLIRSRRGVESMTKVGVWSINLPVAGPATPPMRRRNENNELNPLQTKPHRMAGAAAFMKPMLNFDDFGISFSVCEVNNSAANARYVQWHAGWTPQQARAEAMIHYDRNEIDRVTDYNLAIVVCWARARLQARLVAALPAGGGGTQPSDIIENTIQLERLVLCSDKMKEMELLISDASKISAARPLNRRTLGAVVPV